MIRSKAVAFLFCMVLAGTPCAFAANKPYALTVDPQALAVAQAAFNAMGGSQAFIGYQDSVASGMVTISTGGTAISYPITMKSKGLRETRVELQRSTGTNIRIVNQGQGVIIKPDGSVKTLYSNNTFH